MRHFRFGPTIAGAALCLAASAFPLGSVSVRASAAQDANSKKDAQADSELHQAIAGAGNDRAALVRSLKDYLKRYPASPRRANVYQALVEACQQLRDTNCALDYAERLIALQPDDSDMMMLATNLLQQRGDEASLTRATGYVTRVLDRIEKTSPDQKPPQQSAAVWKQGQDQMRSGLYALRGNVEKSQRNYDAALKDLRQSYSLVPNAVAAIMLGEIAETKNDASTAIDQYLLAFVLPDSGPTGKVDRREVRAKLGNVWRQVHGSEKGLGEAILSAYDRTASHQPTAKTNPAARNQDAKEVFDFVLRRIDGTTVPLASNRGKIVAFSFWATWCSPCRVVEPIFDQVAKGYAGNAKVEFVAVNTDEDETVVAPFMAREKWSVPTAYADGLDEFLKVETLPTIIVFDASGNIVYRTSGLAQHGSGFAASLTSAIDTALSSNH